MITAAGKTALRRYFAGYEATIADTIAVGLGSASGDTMNCEWARFPISNVGTDVDDSLVIFKSESPVSIVGSIYEIGLIQGPGGNSQDVTLSRFTSGEEGWSGGSFTSDNSRLGDGFKINANAIATTTINPISVSGTADKDMLVIAGYASSAGTIAVTLTFDNDATVNGTINVPNGYGFGRIQRSALTKSAGAGWSSVTDVSLKPSVTYTADLLKIQSVNPPRELLIARTVLNDPFTTNTTLPLELEYALEVDVES